MKFYIILVIIGLLSCDFGILLLRKNIEAASGIKITFKMIGLMQIPITLILCLFLISGTIAMIIMISAIVICVVLGSYLSYKSKKSATEPIEAEIVKISSMNMNGRTIYMLTIKYIVDDVEYIKQSKKGYIELTESMSIGSKISIKYNPKDPNNFCME